jgi:hypothetical protein
MVHERSLSTCARYGHSEEVSQGNQVPIFKIHVGKLKKLHAIPLGKEKSLQAQLETNLQDVLDLQFLATEYTTTFGGRIDTLAVHSGGASGAGS